MPDDPLKNPAFKGPGIFEQLGEAFFRSTRPLECIQIETTSVCAGACIYCPHTTHAASWKSRHMSPETFASLWPLLRKAKRAHLQGWGEPLLNPNFFAFQALAAKAGCQTSITTSGLKMDEKIAKAIAKSGMDIVAFSLVGTDEQTNAARARVPFERVKESARLLRDAIAGLETRPEIHLAYLLLADRMEAARALPDLMEEWGVDMAVISTLDYLAVAEQRHLALHNDDQEQIAKAREILEDVQRRCEEKGLAAHFSLPSSAPAPQGCRENIGRCVYVDADGAISPCVYLNPPGDTGAKRVFGNANEKNAMDIWRQEDFKEFRDNLLNGQTEPMCEKCPKRWEG